MPDLQNLLERIEWLDKAATPGPWVSDKSQLYDYVEPHPYDLYEAGEDDPPLASDILPHDAEFIALARTALPQLAKALRAVLEIHKPFHADHYYNGMDGESLHRFIPRCEGCDDVGGIEDYPCGTVQAITDDLKGDDDGNDHHMP